MTYDLSRLSQDIPTSEPFGNADSATMSSSDTNGNSRIVTLSRKASRGSISRWSSVNSVQMDGFINDCMYSDELDKLSIALSEASADSQNESPNSLFNDMVQAQLALWTCAATLLYCYAWVQHRKKFLLSIFVVLPVTFTLTCMMSWLLGIIVIIGRVFSTPVDYTHYFDASRHGGLNFDRNSGYEGFRQRSGSSFSYQGDNILPVPLCRRHSGSNTSLYSCSPPVNRKLSYVYPHYNAVSSDNGE